MYQSLIAFLRTYLHFFNVCKNLCKCGVWRLFCVCVSQLEVRLAEKEESLLEKDLIFEQVTRLSNRVKNKADSGKTDTLNLAKDVSSFSQLS